MHIGLKSNRRTAMKILDMNPWMRRRAVVTGGSGDSIQNTAVVDAPDTYAGVSAQYAHIEKFCGVKGTGWTLESQTFFQRGGRKIDILHVRTADNARRTFYFDVTSFSGRF